MIYPQQATLFALASWAALVKGDKSCSTETCTQTICADYVNNCGIWYGGCFPACEGYTTPSFSVPACPSSTLTTQTVPTDQPGCTTTPDPTPACMPACKDYFDDCGNTYGPGCFTSCPGQPEPSYTTPYCDAEATSTY